MDEQAKLGLARAEVDLAFHKVVTFPLQVGDAMLEAFSIHKLPIKYMLDFTETDERGRVPLLLKYLELCLVNPSDYEKVMELNGEEVLELIEQWMGRSEQAKEIERGRHTFTIESDDDDSDFDS